MAKKQKAKDKADIKDESIDSQETPEEDDLLEEETCLLYTSPSPRDGLLSRMPSSA